MKKKNRLSMMALLVLLTLFLSARVDALGGPSLSNAGLLSTDQTWQREIVYEDGGVNPSLALDATSWPHVSWFGHDGSYHFGLLYARYTNFSWQIEMVDEEGSGNTSLALDDLGDPHISYLGWIGGESRLLYAHYYGGSWHIQDVDGMGSGLETAIAVDSGGLPHIVYGGPSRTTIQYARRMGTGSWQIETVVSLVGTGSTTYFDLALDSADRPHISYYDYDTNALRYAYHDGSAWYFETVDQGGTGFGTGEHNAIALDSQDRPHISYRDLALKYARYDGSAWHLTVVDNDFFAGDNSSIALDSADRPHISYADWNYPDEELRYAYFDGFDWQVETVDVAGETSRYEATSLALDQADQPHIAYHDLGPDHLKYAVYRQPCTPLTGVSVEGPAQLPLGIEGSYTATYTPPEASPPILVAWDNGAVGTTATYSWTAVGNYTIQVTATNLCGQAQDTFPVEVFCQPVEGASISGPQALLVDQAGIYLASTVPLTASRPLTFTWDSGTVGSSASYSWPATGTYTLTVTATNLCGGTRNASFQVRVLEEWPYSVYLPLLMRRQ